MQLAGKTDGRMRRRERGEERERESPPEKLLFLPTNQAARRDDSSLASLGTSPSEREKEGKSGCERKQRRTYIVGSRLYAKILLNSSAHKLRGLDRLGRIAGIPQFDGDRIRRI